MWWRHSRSITWRVLLYRDHALYGQRHASDSVAERVQNEVRADSPAAVLSLALAQIPPRSVVELVFGSDAGHCWLLQGSAQLTEHDWQLLAQAKGAQLASSNGAHVLEAQPRPSSADAVHRLVLSMDLELVEMLQRSRKRIRRFAYANLDRLAAFAAQSSARPLACATRDSAMWTTLVMDASGPVSVAHYPAAASADAVEKALRRTLVSQGNDPATQLQIQDAAPDLSTDLAESEFIFDVLGAKRRTEKRVFWATVVLFLGVVVTASVFRYQLDQDNLRLAQLEAQQQALVEELIPKAADEQGASFAEVERRLEGLESLVKSTPNLNLESLSYQATGRSVQIELSLAENENGGLSAVLDRLGQTGWVIQGINRLDDAAQHPGWVIRASLSAAKS